MHEKILNIQKELKVPKNQFNSFGKYKYRSCEDIIEHAKPLCNKEGLTLSLSDEVIEVGGRVYVKATASLSDGEKTFSCSGIAREAETKKGMDESQITGSTSSYARKYALNGLFAIDDVDDADATNEHKEVKMTVAEAVKKLGKAESLEELKEIFLKLPKYISSNAEVVARKDELKEVLNV